MRLPLASVIVGFQELFFANSVSRWQESLVVIPGCALSLVLRTMIRDAKYSEIDQLAKIWFDGWQDAHAQLLPVELARLRSLKSFEERLA